MNLVLAGINYKTAPVSIRESIAFRDDDLPKAFELIRTFSEIRESAILSTCNRTEIYAVTNSLEMSDVIPEYLARYHEIPSKSFLPHLYTKEGLDAARHLFVVTSGLDSLVVGENQILSQVKQFFRRAQEAKSLGTILHRLFQCAILAGKRIRHETTLGENPGSVGEAAVELAKQIFGELKEKAVLVLGAGKMGRLILEALTSAGVSSPMVASRTFEKAKEVAEELHGIPYSLDDLDQPLQKSDIIITATNAATPVLKRARLEGLMRERRFSPLFIIDIGVPRDVEATAGQLENLFLYNIDDLKQIVSKSNESLQKEMVKAEEILDEELLKFQTWKDSLQVIPIIKALTFRMEEFKSKETEKVFQKFPNLSEQEREAIENLAHSLINKILHRPLVQLKTFADHPLGIEYLEVTRTLFGLGEKND